MTSINNVGIKKIGVISDTHIPSRAKSLPKEIYNYFKGANFIIHCGDIVNNGVITELETIAPVYAVKGNMDSHEITYSLEITTKINDKFIVCISHGSGSPYVIKDKLYKTFSKDFPYMIIFGHTHSAYNDTFKNIKYFNPGSATCGIKYNSIGLLEVEDNEIICNILQI